MVISMEIMTLPLFLLVGLAIILAGVSGWLLGRRASDSRHAIEASQMLLERAALHERTALIEGRFRDMTAEIQRLGALLAESQQAQAAAKATLESERAATEEKLALLRNAEEQMKNTFTALSSAALQSNNESFLQLANETLGKHSDGAAKDFAARQKAIDDIVKPVAETLTKMESALQQVQTDRVSTHATLQEQFAQIRETHAQLRDETGRLVTALRTPHVRGRWGEIQLRRVVEIAGMLPYCDFEEQPQTDEPGRLRPDLRVNLPGGKLVVVDAKVALDAYLAALETKDEDTRISLLADHARQVRDHMLKLGAKGCINRKKFSHWGLLPLPAACNAVESGSGWSRRDWMPFAGWVPADVSSWAIPLTTGGLVLSTALP